MKFGLFDQLGSLARQAGSEILAVRKAVTEVRFKGDASPVTEADERAEAIILRGLAALESGVPVVAEESVARGVMPDVADRFWLVDPLDGTREFISGSGEFTVNIALVE